MGGIALKKKTNKMARTGKWFPNNGRSAHEPPLGLDLVHHKPARLIDEGSVQGRVPRENKPHSHRVVSASSQVDRDTQNPPNLSQLS